MIVFLQVWDCDVPSVISALESGNIQIQSGSNDDGVLRLQGKAYIRCAIPELQLHLLQSCPGVVQIYDHKLPMMRDERKT